MRFVIKYALVFSPLIVCTLVSEFLLSAEPAHWRDDPHGARSEESLEFLASRWFLIGCVVTGTFLVCVTIDDLFSLARKWWKRSH